MCPSDTSRRENILFTHNTITGCLFRWGQAVLLSSNVSFMNLKCGVLLQLSLCYAAPQPRTAQSCAPRFMGSYEDSLPLMWSPWTQAPSRTGRGWSPRSVWSTRRYSCIISLMHLNKQNTVTTTLLNNSWIMTEDVAPGSSSVSDSFNCLDVFILYPVTT